MFNDIRVFSREGLISHSESISKPTVIISISDVGAEHPEFHDNPNILDVLYLFFDDEESGDNSMTDDDASNMVDFIRKYDNDNLDLLFHCNAGVSRSAACAAASMLIEWGDDSAIFSDGKYCPNMHCYRTVLNAADITYDDIELARKEKKQFDLWKEDHLEEYGL